MATIEHNPGCPEEPTVLVEIYDGQALDALMFVCERCYVGMTRRIPSRILWDSHHNQQETAGKLCGDMQWEG
jgi:hypothetical protein